MKRLVFILCAAICLLQLQPLQVRAQNRQTGQAVVPLGWESQDSIRWGLYGFEPTIEPAGYLAADTLGCNFDLLFSDPKDSGWSTHKMRAGEWAVIGDAGNQFHNRIFYPSPRPFSVEFNQPTYWRYNDIFINPADCAWIDSEYQNNDISPYAQYSQDLSLNSEKFKPQGRDSVAFKDEGRLILGYSIQNDAADLLHTFQKYPFAYWDTAWVQKTADNKITTAYDIWKNGDSLLTSIRAGGGSDTIIRGRGPIPRQAKAFAATLEFNVADRTSDPNEFPDTSGYESNTSTVPLLKLQILYKSKGANLLPFSPFKRFPGDTNKGWYALVDTTITRGIYNTLDTDWRVQDSVFEDANGNALATPHPARGWKFKQLHLLVRLPSDTILPSPYAAVEPISDSEQFAYTTAVDAMQSQLLVPPPPPHCTYGDDSAYQKPITCWQHPDSLVAPYGQHGELTYHGNKEWDQDLIEIRVYSTYRSTIRIRSLEWRDTTADKFFYRKRFGPDDTRNLIVGTYGSYDDSVNAYFSAAKVRRDSGDNRVPDEVFWLEATGGGLRSSAIAVLDYFGSKYGFHSHLHEQDDDGGCIREFRRMRRSFDGTTPSMYENQASQFTADASLWRDTTDFHYHWPHDIFPVDYVSHAIDFSNTLAWPLNATDTCAGMIIGRPNADIWAYRLYDSLYAGLPIAMRWRGTVSFAQNHPLIKKFAVEADPQGWGELHVNVETTTDTTYNHWRWTPRYNSVKVGGYYDSVGHCWHGGVMTNLALSPNWYNQRPTTPEENTGHVFTALANGISSFGTAQVFDDGRPTGGAPGSFGWQKRYQNEPNWWLVDTLNHYYNFGHRYSAGWIDQWTGREANVLTSDMDGPLPEYYLGYSNNYKSMHLLFSRIQNLWASRHGNNLRPVRRFRWIGSYSAHSDNQTPFFLKVPLTQSVKRYQHLTDWGYIDSLAFDSSNQRFVEVGTFRDSNGNFAAMVVNTRLWPDPDTSRYNSNSDTPTNDVSKWVALKDRCSASLGSIDARKVYLRIDTSVFKANDQNFRSRYYVVRDLEHQDSSWLVKSDSLFAIYLKPGDARFLYLEKGIALDAAKRSGTDTGKANVNDFCFNNGRRIAERMGGTREVVTYTRNGKLYVAYPSKGAVIPGYPERTSGDNIATGYEQLLDSVNTCAKPSICVARNDVGVGLSYWYQDAVGKTNIAFMYQPHPDSSWRRVACPYTINFNDTSSDKHFITPVLTPYNDTTWFIAAGSHAGTAPAGIAGLLATAHANGTVTFDLFGGGLDRIWLASDNPAGSTARAVFPTLASAPIQDNLYPIRFAWQQGDGSAHNCILYERWKSLRTTPAQSIAVDVAKQLDACDNRHPSITFNATKTHQNQYWATYYDDNITWEAQLKNMTGLSNRYWPIARARHELRDGLPYLPVGFVTWGAYDVFKRGQQSIGEPQTFRWPQFTSASRIYDGKFSYNIENPQSTFHDWLRIAWDDLSGAPYFASWDAGWYESRLSENGRYPSVPNRTDSLTYWTDSTATPRPVVFLNQGSSSIGQTRITNGLFPYVTKLQANIHFVIKPAGTPSEDSCIERGIKIDIGNPPTRILRGNPKEPVTDVYWQLSDVGSVDYPDAWSASVPNEYHSDAFSITGGDQIQVGRALSSTNLQEIRDSLSLTDRITWKLTLRKLSDSSYITTIDSLTIAKGDVHWIGTGIDSVYANTIVPVGWPADSGFIMVELNRLDTANTNLSRTMIETFDSGFEAYSPKRANAIRPIGSNLRLDVQPNPFNGSTQILAEVVEGEQTSVEIYDLIGNKVVSLYNGAPHGSNLNLTLNGTSLTSGSYLVRVSSGGNIVTQKIELVR